MNVGNVNGQDQVSRHVNQNTTSKSLCRQDYKVMALFTLITLSSLGILMNDNCKEWNADLDILELERDFHISKDPKKASFDLLLSPCIDKLENKLSYERLQTSLSYYCENSESSGCVRQKEMVAKKFDEFLKADEICKEASKKFLNSLYVEKYRKAKIIYKQQAKPFMCSRR